MGYNPDSPFESYTRRLSCHFPGPASSPRTRFAPMQALWGFLHLAFLAALLSLLSPASAFCYFPDGSLSDDTPCTDKTPNSTCCASGYACLGNTDYFFLCMSTGSEIQKPGC